jgi:ABC-2 type transport system permease protein
MSDAVVGRARRPVMARGLTTTCALAAVRAAAQRGGLAFTVFFHVIVSWALSAVWRASVGAAGGAIAGYDLVAITWYVVFAEACTVTMRNRLIADIGEAIEGGGVQTEMLRPASVVLVRIAAEVGGVVVRVAVCLVTGSLLAFALVRAVPDPVAVGLGVVSAMLAVTCNLCLQHAFATVAFVLRHTGSAWFLYAKVVFVIGGMLIPLELLPRNVERVARVLPFQAMAYAPARLGAGFRDWWLLLHQCGWIVVCVALAMLAFRAGERRVLEGRS